MWAMRAKEDIIASGSRTGGQMALGGFAIYGGAKSDQEAATNNKKRVRLAPCTGGVVLGGKGGARCPRPFLEGQGEMREAYFVSFFRCSKMIRFKGYPQYGIIS